MAASTSYYVAFVTAPNRSTARKLAQRVLAQRLAACVNIVPMIESHYWWQGRVESGRENLMILKTTRSKLAALERCILAHHPYDTAEFIALPIARGAAKYLRWVQDSVNG